MTGKEIEKALECCGSSIGCKECPVGDRKSPKTCQDMCAYTLDYIKRLKEEKYQLEQNLGQCENGYNLELLTANMRIRSLEQDKEQIRKETERNVAQEFCYEIEQCGLDYGKVMNTLKRLAEKYEVEVDE